MTMVQSDDKALRVAQRVQQREQPELAILFGSRARGDHDELQSDIDILMVQAREPTPAQASAAVREAQLDTLHIYGRDIPVQLIWRTLEEFRHNRRYINSIETQAVRQGVIMPRSPGQCDSSDYEDAETEYEYGWTTYDQRLRHAELYLQEFLDTAERGRHDMFIGRHAQSTLEHGMKALLEAHGAPYRRVHNLGELLGNIRRCDPELRDFRLAIPLEVYDEYAGDLAYNRRARPELTSYPDYVERPEPPPKASSTGPKRCGGGRSLPVSRGRSSTIFANAGQTRGMTMVQSDDKALRVAQRVQQREQPELAILFGSRARGDHDELQSDIDILMVQAREPTPAQASAAVREAQLDTLHIYGRDIPVQLIWRTLEEFRHNRRYINSIETQAVRQGVIMPRSPGQCDSSDYEDAETEYEYGWTTYDQRLRHAELNLDGFLRMAEQDFHDMFIGRSAQSTLEHGMKALLEAHGAPYRRVHNLGELLGNIRRCDPALRDFRLAIPPEVYDEYAGDLAYNRRSRPELTSYPDYVEKTRAAAEGIINRAKEVRGRA